MHFGGSLDISVPAVDEEVCAVAVALQPETTLRQQLRSIELARFDEVFQFCIAQGFQPVDQDLPELSSRNFLYVERICQVDFSRFFLQ